MAGQLSPDGKWFWDGEQWIPAPPQSNETTAVSNSNPILQQPENYNYPQTESLVYITNKNKTGFINAKVLSIAGIVVILLTSVTLWLYIQDDSESCIIKAIQAENDEPLGGIIDSTTTYSYSSEGLLALEEEVSWEGAIIDRTTYSYDSDGNLIEEYRVFESDFSRDRMTYDSNGNMLTRDKKDSLSFNDDEREIYTYNEDGKITKKEIDVNIDGTIDEETTYEYNSLGLEIFSYTDSDMDGDFDSSETSYYDSENQLIETKTDDQMDGSVDDITIYRYDSRGNLIEMKSDYGNDGSYEFIFSYSFDDEDRPTHSIMTVDFEGTWLDMRTITTMSYNDDGSYTAVSSTFEGDEQTRTITTEYGCVA